MKVKELALHIRNIADINKFTSLDKELKRHYIYLDDDHELFKNSSNFRKINRIYIGDEFCVHRLPKVDQLIQFCEISNKLNLNITFLTPPLTEIWLKQVNNLFKVLYNWRKKLEVEIVINDWGVFYLLKEKYPEFHISIGRLLNKGFKDPRFKDVENWKNNSSNFKEILEEGTFDQDFFIEFLNFIGISRIEKDLFPYGDTTNQLYKKEIPFSIYFPFGYITTGRVCWIANIKSKDKFVTLKNCFKPCNFFSFYLNNPLFCFPVKQSGNTVFYKYSPESIVCLLNNSFSFRLVYQGLSL